MGQTDKKATTKVNETSPKQADLTVDTKVEKEARTAAEDDKIAKAKEEKEISRVEKAAETAKVTMKNFEDAVKKVREQKDLKIGQKVELSAFR